MAMVAMLFLPIWRIELSAPQYPEGLALRIYAGKLGGNIEVINGLNHYIGMRTLHEKDFAEFRVLPYVISAFILFGLVTAFINRKWLFYTLVLFFLLFAGTAMMDFYRWEYNYGHNLDPTAPIQVPGMSYQPPLIGYKKLLNFGATSIPDFGGWIFAGAGLLLTIAGFFEWKNNRNSVKLIPVKAVLPLIGGMLLIGSCNRKPQPIHYGSDACDFCRMVVTNRHFGGEVVTKKGKVYKFDDIHCELSFLQSHFIIKNDIADIYLVDFSVPDQFIKASESFLLKSEALRSPMGGNAAAFKSTDSITKFQRQFNGTVITWSKLYP